MGPGQFATQCVTNRVSHEERKGQALHGRVEADVAIQSEIGSLSDLPFVVHADSKAPEKTAASAGPSQGDLSRSRWAAGVAPSQAARVEFNE